MERTKIIFGIGSFVLSLLVFTSYLDISFGHTSKTFGNTTIEVGWLSEPPLVSDLNSITLQASKGSSSSNQTPILNALANLSLSVKYGTITKQFDFEPSPTTDGAYEGKIIPTRIGPYSLLLQGDVKGQKVDSEFKIEDVESKSILSFPDKSPDTSNSNNIGQNIQDAISKSSIDIESNRKDLNTSQEDVRDIQESLNGLQGNLTASYLISVTAVGIGIAGIVMAAYLFTVLRFKKGMPQGA
jgi:ABC-type glycerol-3-phosphate transport system permease component